MGQVVRTLTVENEAPLIGRALICDRDAKWSAPVRTRLAEPGIRRLVAGMAGLPTNLVAVRGIEPRFDG